MIYGLHQRSQILVLTLFLQSQSESKVLGKPSGFCVCWTRRGRKPLRVRIRRVERRSGAGTREYHSDLAGCYACGVNAGVCLQIHGGSVAASLNVHFTRTHPNVWASPLHAPSETGHEQKPVLRRRDCNAT